LENVLIILPELPYVLKEKNGIKGAKTKCNHLIDFVNRQHSNIRSRNLRS